MGKNAARTKLLEQIIRDYKYLQEITDDVMKWHKYQFKIDLAEEELDFLTNERNKDGDIRIQE